MANTVIAVRSSGTAAATPSLGVIANGEIALNYADGIIYYKTSSNTLGSIRTTQPAGLTTEVQYNDAGSFGSNANFTFNKTIATLNVKNINVSTNLVTTNLVTTNLTTTYLTTGSGVGGIIAGANVVYSNTFIANTGGITTAGNSSLNGIVTVSYVAGTGNQNAAMEMIGANTKGGTGYFDFISANNNSGGVTNKNKWFRIDSNGKFQIINSAYTANIFDLNDSGYLTVPGGIATSQYIQFADGSKQYTANAGSGSSGLANSGALITVNSASQLYVSNTTISTSNTTGALTIAGGLGVNGNVYSANVFATGDIVAGIFDGPTLAGATNPIFAAIGNTNSYVQNYVVNYSNTANASADWAAYPNNGNDASGWIDMGITSNNYSQAGYSTTGRNEGYLLMSAPSGSGTSGNLVIATDTTGSYNSIEFYANGFNQTKSTSAKLTITKQTTSTSNTTGAVLVVGGAGVKGNVYADNVFISNQLAATIGDAMAMAIALG